MINIKMRTQMVAAGVAVLALGLAGCSGSSGSSTTSGATSSAAAEGTISVGFAQVGAESAWRAANT